MSSTSLGWTRAARAVEVEFEVTTGESVPHKVRTVKVGRKEAVTIGRAIVESDQKPDNLLFSYKTISARHGLLRLTRDMGLVFEDTSRNGSQLNRKTVVPGKAYELDEGYRLSFGSNESKVTLVVKTVKNANWIVTMNGKGVPILSREVSADEEHDEEVMEIPKMTKKTKCKDAEDTPNVYGYPVKASKDALKTAKAPENASKDAIDGSADAMGTKGASKDPKEASKEAPNASNASDTSYTSYASYSQDAQDVKDSSNAPNSTRKDIEGLHPSDFSDLDGEDWGRDDFRDDYEEENVPEDDNALNENKIDISNAKDANKDVKNVKNVNKDGNKDVNKDVQEHVHENVVADEAEDSTNDSDKADGDDEINFSLSGYVDPRVKTSSTCRRGSGCLNEDKDGGDEYYSDVWSDDGKSDVNVSGFPFVNYEEQVLMQKKRESLDRYMTWSVRRVEMPRGENVLMDKISAYYRQNNPGFVPGCSLPVAKRLMFDSEYESGDEIAKKDWVLFSVGGETEPDFDPTSDYENDDDFSDYELEDVPEISEAEVQLMKDQRGMDQICNYTSCCQIPDDRKYRQLIEERAREIHREDPPFIEDCRFPFAERLVFDSDYESEMEERQRYESGAAIDQPQMDGQPQQPQQQSNFNNVGVQVKPAAGSTVERADPEQDEEAVGVISVMKGPATNNSGGCIEIVDGKPLSQKGHGDMADSGSEEDDEDSADGSEDDYGHSEDSEDGSWDDSEENSEYDTNGSESGPEEEWEVENGIGSINPRKRKRDEDGEEIEDQDNRDVGNAPRVESSPRSKVRCVSKFIAILGAGAVLGSVGTIIGLAASAAAD